jgi:hypothetical protein
VKANKADTNFSTNNIVHRGNTSIVNNTYTQRGQPMHQYDPRVTDAPNSGSGVSYSNNGKTAWLQQPNAPATLKWDDAKGIYWDTEA